MTNNSDPFVKRLYTTSIGRVFLKTIMITRADKLIVAFLKSHLSKYMLPQYVRKNGLKYSRVELAGYRSFRDFFARENNSKSIDFSPTHLISPCDGWLSVYEISESSLFKIKGSIYSTNDLLQDDTLAQKYTGGLCLVFRLCASDYHHYCYIDDCTQGDNHYIEGELHSVQPIALANYKVFARNRRSWCVMDTENFGSVTQIEIGALVVGGIVNPNSNVSVSRGDEKGHFDLAGSTIVLMFEPGRIGLLPMFNKTTTDNEARVRQGMWIGIARS